MRRKEINVRLHRLAWGVVVAALLLFPAGAPSGAGIPPGSPDLLQAENFQAGNLLVAAPGMADPRFRKSVILLVKHDASGAFGLVLNRTLGTVDISMLLGGKKPAGPRKSREVLLHYGGPVQATKGFVLYASDKPLPNSIRVGKRIAVSSDASLLNAIARGEGPEKMMIALGYAGWRPGQLKAEMRRGDWFTAPAEEDILFDESHPTKWRRAMDRRFRTL